LQTTAREFFEITGGDGYLIEALAVGLLSVGWKIRELP
jgi:hypothetical protein